MSYFMIDQSELKPDEVRDFRCCWPCIRESKEFEACDMKCACKSYWFYNIVAAIFHLFNGLLMIILFYANGRQDVCYQLHMPYASWTPVGNITDSEEPDFIIIQDKVNTSKLSLHWLIVGFHLLSFVFQIAVIFLDEKSRCRIQKCFKYNYTELIEEQGINPLRFVEYSISASIMLVCIGLLTGIRSENEIIAIAVLCSLCQLFGLIAEITTQQIIRTLCHVAGWVSLMTSYGIIWLYYGIANYQGGQRDPPQSAPDVVHIVVTFLFVLFNSFGIVQTTQMCCRGNKKSFWFKWVGQESELSYVFLSLVAKTLLGWLIYSNVLVMSRECS
jgi:hypothetical protein